MMQRTRANIALESPLARPAIALMVRIQWQPVMSM